MFDVMWRLWMATKDVKLYTHLHRRHFDLLISSLSVFLSSLYTVFSHNVNKHLSTDR